jgi:hypothetical protein
MCMCIDLTVVFRHGEYMVIRFIKKSKSTLTNDMYVLFT